MVLRVVTLIRKKAIESTFSDSFEAVPGMRTVLITVGIPQGENDISNHRWGGAGAGRVEGEGDADLENAGQAAVDRVVLQIVRATAM